MFYYNRGNRQGGRKPKSRNSKGPDLARLHPERSPDLATRGKSETNREGTLWVSKGGRLI